MSRRVERLWRTEGGGPVQVLRGLLVALSWLFAVAVGLRRWCYDAGFARVHKADVAVISVGNLCVGGSGKTPLVLWLLERLQRRGVSTVVVSRGYGVALARPLILLPRSAFDERRVAAVRAVETGVDVVAVTADGPVATARVPAQIADEPLLIAVRAAAAVVVWPDRVRAAAIAARALRAQALVLDDGFQHRRLYRDFDIVVLGEGDLDARLLPAGPLREAPRALSRADVVIAPAPVAAGARLRRSAGALVRSVDEAAPLHADALSEVEVVAFAGLARPRSFLDLLTDAGALVREFIVFADHHVYTGADWDRIMSAAAGVRYIVTTEKDLVKLGRLAAHEERLRALRLRIDIEGGDEIVERVVRCISSRISKG